MSYKSEVQADAPLAAAGLDELSGTTSADYSGNGNDLELFEDVTYGLTSPIETDGAERAMGGQVGVFPAAVDPRITWTDEVWILNTESLITGTGLCRGGQVGLSASNYVAIDSGQARAQISTTGGSYDLFWPLPALGWYHIVAGRLGALMVMYVNGFLRAARTDLDTGLRSGWGFGDSTTYHVGVGTTSSAWASAATDEPAVYDYLLSADRVLAHYEAALLNPPVFLRADLHFNCYIAGDFAPPPALFPFTPNWENPIKETLSWLTDVLPAREDYEQRAAVRMRPRRSLEYDFSFLSNPERRLYHAFLFANKKRPIYIPIDTDAVPLTNSAPISSTELEFVSTYFDFNDGGKLALYENEKNSEVLEIDTVGETSTSLVTPTTKEWPTNSRVVPVVRALVEPIQISRITDSIEDIAATFRILAEDVPLAPHRLGTYTPRYTLNDIEVFDPFVLGPNNWNEDGKGQISIRSTDPESAAGVFTRTPWDTAPREITSYSFFLDGRPEIAQFLAWWWNMEGRTKPIWVPSLQEDFTILASNTGPLRITVAGHEQTDYYRWHQARRDLAIVYKDQTIVFKRIGDGEASGANDILFLEGFGGVSLTNLWFCSFLKLSRLNEDTIELVWHTDQLVEVTLNFIDETPTDDQ